MGHGTVQNKNHTYFLVVAPASIPRGCTSQCLASKRKNDAFVVRLMFSREMQLNEMIEPRARPR